MSVDIEKLKALAEQATPGPWKAQHPNAGQRGSEVASADGLNQICADLGPTNSLYIAAANPAAVLELIADHKRMASRLLCCTMCGGQGEVYSGRTSYEGYNQPPEPIMDKCGECDGAGVLGDEQECLSILDELEQVKAENAGLKTGYAAYEQVNGELRAEVEALRKDAERYRWFRSQHWDGSVICAVVDPKLTTRLGAYCPSGKLLDDAVDAGIAMSKEAYQ